MLIHLETSSGVPIYRQVVDQIKSQAAAERLKAGERIPSVRQLAVSLAVNPLTIAKAYSELEREGIIETQRGIGTFVARGIPRLSAAERMRNLREISDKLAAESARLCVPRERVEALLKESLDRYGEGLTEKRS